MYKRQGKRRKIKITSQEENKTIDRDKLEVKLHTLNLRTGEVEEVK